jgi:hypothetical protein
MISRSGESIMRGQSKSQSSVLCRWLRNELDVVETYKLALQRLHGPDDVAAARESMLEHANYALELREVLRKVGCNGVDAHAVPHTCTKERLAMVALRGDEAVVDALLDNEHGRLQAYEAALRRGDGGSLVTRLVARSLDPQEGRVARLSARAAALHSTGKRAA